MAHLVIVVTSLQIICYNNDILNRNSSALSYLVLYAWNAKRKIKATMVLLQQSNSVYVTSFKLVFSKQMS